MSIYDYEFINLNGEIVKLDKYKNKYILIVNTASLCGHTPQYAKLQELYSSKSDDLEIIAFPCNQFGNQEPGSDDEIKNVCDTYNVTFTVAKKIDVNGDNAHPIYKYLKEKSNLNKDIEWNFEKFLIDKNENITHFRSQYSPTLLASKINN
jgi:glutathione peroxidase